MVVEHRLANGLTVIVEELEHLRSAAYYLLVPGGIMVDPEDRLGSSLILADLTSRGAGERDSRALSDAFEDLGIRHSESAGHDRFGYRGTLVAEHLEAALALVADMVQRPTLPEGDIASIRSLLLQDLASLEDNPARLIHVHFERCYYPSPYNRSAYGSVSGLNACDADGVSQEHARCYGAKGSVLSVAGRVRAAEVIKCAERLFGAWSGSVQPRPEFGELPTAAAHHVEYDSAQLQIAIGAPSVKFGEPHYYTAKVANGVLSGGMFGRLFVEVREKRGLCYSVYSRHAATDRYGTIYAYAGTTPERAEETLQVLVDELRGLTRVPVSREELGRAKVNIKAALVIGEESSGARASSNASDWLQIGRVRSLEEIEAQVEAVDDATLAAYLAEYPLNEYTLVTLGTKALSRV